MNAFEFLAILGLGIWIWVHTRRSSERIRALENELTALRSQQMSVKPVELPAPQPESAMERAKREAAEKPPTVPEPQPEAPPKPAATPPPMPAFAPATETKPEPTPPPPPAAKPVPAASTPAPPEPVPAAPPKFPAREPQPAFELQPILEKIKLWPPSGENAEAAIGAWWLSRLGLIVLIIGAVFFGVRIAENTPPWVRLATLGAIATGVTLLGVWLERKLTVFGRLISAGGLALGYFTALAAYGIEATKVIDNPGTGFLVQAAAVVVVVAWSWWKKDEAIASMAVLLGLIACLFSHYHDLDHFVMLGLLCLAAGGGALLVLRSWLWPHTIGMAGAWFGFFVLGVFDWPRGGGPGYALELGSVVLLAVVLELASFIDQGRHASEDGHQGKGRWRRYLALANTSLAVAVGWLAIRLSYPSSVEDGQMPIFYLTFAGLTGAFAALRGWRRHPIAITETFFLKAMGLLALYFVAKFDGPTRWLSLSGQTVALVWAWRRSRLLWVEVGLAALFAGTLTVIAHDVMRPVEGEWAFFSIRHVVGFVSLTVLTLTLALHARWSDSPEPDPAAEEPIEAGVGAILRMIAGGLAGLLVIPLVDPGSGPAAAVLTSVGALMVAAPLAVGRSFPPLLAGLIALGYAFGLYLQPSGSAGWNDTLTGLWLILLAFGGAELALRFWDRKWHFGNAVRVGLSGAGLWMLAILLIRHTGDASPWICGLCVLLVAAAAGFVGIRQSVGFAVDHLSGNPVSSQAMRWALGAVSGLILIGAGIELMPDADQLPIVLTVAAALVFASAWLTRSAVPALAGGLPLLMGFGVYLYEFENSGGSSLHVVSTLVIVGISIATSWVLSRQKIRLGLMIGFDAVLQVLAVVSVHWLLRTMLPMPQVFLADALLAVLMVGFSNRLPFRSLPFVSALPWALGLLHFGRVWVMEGAVEDMRWVWWIVAVAVGGWLWLAYRRMIESQPVVGRRVAGGFACLAAGVLSVVGFRMLPEPWHLVSLAGVSVAMAGLGWFGKLPGCRAWSIVPLVVAMVASLARIAGVIAGPEDATLVSVITVSVLIAAHGVILTLKATKPERSRVWVHGLAALGLAFIAFASPTVGVDSLTTVCWGATAIVLFGIGLVAGLKPYRLTGLLGLGLSMVRMFLIDIEDPLYRIYAFFAIAAVLLGVGYLYHRFRHLIERADGVTPPKPDPELRSPS
ncbi:hypothetical protein HAHE_20500 [Haloferula helveola]|uniref:DUF2339 domain-containing protein n=1 Tax=Haloferula helveola TaxID=490095 RepID=A0ABN6H687_9BACT|nr:hypothetical protein HAHE_20500 [Haloferula helveola]